MVRGVRAVRGVQPVPIVDARSPDAHARYEEAVRMGNPLVLTGPPMKCLTEFAAGWFETGQFDPHEFAASCGTAEAPVCRMGYQGAQQHSQLETAEKMSVKLFVNLHWPESSENMYLAQWQFASHVVDDEDELSAAWRLSSVPEDVVGVDFLSTGSAEMYNPYQYVFMGGRQTQSRMHNDLGGFSIFITVLVGAKDVLMVHRDDEHLMYGMHRNYELLNGDDFPLAAGARVWRHVVVPGDVLVMPPRTIHQVVNPAPCLSYTRCHVGPAEMNEWLRAHDVGDEAAMEHAHVVFQAGHRMLADANADTRATREALTCLRDATCVFASRLTESDGARSWLRLHEDLAGKAQSSAAVPRMLVQSDRDALTAGDYVVVDQALLGGPRATAQRACIVKVLVGMAGVVVKYKDAFASFPPEIVPLSNIFSARSSREMAPGAPCTVAWGVLAESFEATVVESVVADVVEVQFVGLGSEWNQFVRVRDLKCKCARAMKIVLEPPRHGAFT